MISSWACGDCEGNGGDKGIVSIHLLQVPSRSKSRLWALVWGQLQNGGGVD